MAKSGNELLRSVLMVGVGYGIYSLALQNELGGAAHRLALDIKNAIEGVQRGFVAGANTAASGGSAGSGASGASAGGGGGQPQVAAITRFSSYNPIDLGQQRDAAHGWAWDQDSGTVYLINPPYRGIGRATTITEAIALASRANG